MTVTITTLKFIENTKRFKSAEFVNYNKNN